MKHIGQFGGADGRGAQLLLFSGGGGKEFFSFI